MFMTFSIPGLEEGGAGERQYRHITDDLALMKQLLSLSLVILFPVAPLLSSTTTDTRNAKRQERSKAVRPALDGKGVHAVVARLPVNFGVLQERVHVRQGFWQLITCPSGHVGGLSKPHGSGRVGSSQECVQHLTCREFF